MKTIDRYIINESIYFSIISISIVSAIIVMFIFFNLIDETALNAKLLGYSLIASALRLGQFSSYAIGLGTTIGIAALVSIMSRNHEITVIKGFGLNDLQIVKPFMLTAGLFSLMSIMFSSFISPRMLVESNRILYTKIKKEEGFAKVNPVNSWIKHKIYLCNIGYYDTQRNIAFDVKCVELKKTLKKYIEIERLEWKDLWIAKIANIWEIKNSTIEHKLQESFTEDILPKPSYLSKQFKTIDEVTISELIDIIKLLKKSHVNTIRFKIAIVKKLHEAIAILFMAFIVFPLVTKNPRDASVGESIILGTIASSITFGIIELFKFLTEISLLNITLAVVGPIFILMNIAFMVYKLKYEK